MSTLLFLHITGGILAGVVIFRSAFVLIKSQKKSYPNLVRALSFLAAFEVLSGVLLAYASPKYHSSITLYQYRFVPWSHSSDLCWFCLPQ